MHNMNRWARRVEVVHEWTEKMDRAYARCQHEAASERVLGYVDSAKAYTEMAEEMKMLRWWVLGMAGQDDWSAK